MSKVRLIVKGLMIFGLLGLFGISIGLIVYAVWRDANPVKAEEVAQDTWFQNRFGRRGLDMKLLGLGVLLFLVNIGLLVMYVKGVKASPRMRLAKEICNKNDTRKCKEFYKAIGKESEWTNKALEDQQPDCRREACFHSNKKRLGL